MPSGTRYPSASFGFFRVYIVALCEESALGSGQPVTCMPCVADMSARGVSQKPEPLPFVCIVLFGIAPPTLPTRRVSKLAVTTVGPEVEVAGEVDDVSRSIFVCRFLNYFILIIFTNN